MCVFAGQWYVLYGNIGLMLVHYILVVLFGYYLPCVVFEHEDYRLISYVALLMFNFVVFMLLYLNVSSEADFLGDRSWTEVLLFDVTMLMTVGFIGAMFCTKYMK